MDDSYILWFDDITSSSVNKVGKKAVSLAELRRAGVRVPYGFVLTMDAYDVMLIETGLGEKIGMCLKSFNGEALQSLVAAEEAGRQVLCLFREADLPDIIRTQIVEGYGRLCEQAGEEKIPVAVRSSGPLSRPGLFSSYLNVKGTAELEKRVMECWASVYLPRALAMRAQKGHNLAREPIGVVVCQFINARSAGVLFTIHPVTGNRSKMLIESAWGLGESVAQSDLVPDRFIVDRHSLEIEEREISTKLSRIAPSKDSNGPDGSNQGVTIEVVSAAMKDAPSLKYNEILELIKQAEIVENHFKGVPQDIEWAVSGSFPFPENIFFLQSRPVTGLEPGGKSIEKPGGLSDSDHISNLMIDRLFS